MTAALLLCSILVAAGVARDEEDTFLLDPPQSERLFTRGTGFGGDRDRDGSITILLNQESPQRLDVAADQALILACRNALSHNLQLFEASEQDLELQLVSIDRDARAGQATAFFVQTAGSVRIEGTQVICSVHGNRVAFLRHVLVRPPALKTLPRIASSEAIGKILRAHPRAQLAPAESQAARPERVIVFVAATPGARRTPTLSWRAEINLEEEHERYNVFLDAVTGRELGAFSLAQALIQGQLTVPIELSCHGDAQVTVPLPFADIGKDHFADGDGLFELTHETSEVTVKLESPYVRLIDHDVSQTASYALPISPYGFNEVLLEDVSLALSSPYYHVHHARAWAKNLTSTRGSQQAFLDSRLDVHVNLRAGSCDAYYNGSLNFLAAGNGCLNTGRAAAIVYHEYAHALHAHSVPSGMPAGYDGQVSEGVSDYVAATLTESPFMRGLTSCSDAFRSCANRLSWCAQGGCDFDSTSEDHDTGQVLCAALWELRELLRTKLGPRAGAEATDRIVMRFLPLVGGMASVYPAMIAADEDDDADPTNGTAHSCEINRAFAGAGSFGPAHFPKLEHLVPCRRRLH